MEAMYMIYDAEGEAIYHQINHLVQPRHHRVVAVQYVAPHSQHQRVKFLGRKFTHVGFKRVQLSDVKKYGMVMEEWKKRIVSQDVLELLLRVCQAEVKLGCSGGNE